AALYPQYRAHRFLMGKADVPEVPYESGLPKNLKIRFEKTPVAVSAVLYGAMPGPGPARTVATRLVLYANLPVADIEVLCDKPLDAWPEAGWICLPLNLARPRFRLGKLGADLDPIKDITVENVNFRQMWVNTGVAVYDESGYGVGLSPLDSPLVSLGEPGSHKFESRYEPKAARVYLNLYNTHWHTNFASWTGGRLASRVRLWTFDKFDSESALYTPSMEARVPLRVAKSRTKPGHLPPTQPGLVL
ncbi:MAG: hypothetical protein NUV77_16930, partial [Thermoguttaceae bacterium]|nr:hypothetical protein [Thermoguttaceae bacterium]